MLSLLLSGCHLLKSYYLKAMRTVSNCHIYNTINVFNCTSKGRIPSLHVKLATFKVLK